MPRLVRLFSLTRTQRYGVALVGVVLATLLRLVLDPVLKADLPLFLFFLPVVAASWIGGLGPGLVATVLSLLAGDYLFIEPRGAILQVPDVPSQARLAALAFMSIVFTILFDRLRTRVQRQLESLDSLTQASRFIASIHEALMSLSDPVEIVNTAVMMLGEYLQADRCAYAETDADTDTLMVRGDYSLASAPGPPSLLRMSRLEELNRRALRDNRPCILPPDGGPDGAGVHALVVPVRREGVFAAAIEVQQYTPRQWTGDEVRLLQTVASLCWESVERARALQRLKDSDDRYRAFIANTSEGVWRFELEEPIPLTAPENEYLDMLYRFGYLAESNDMMARMYGYDNAQRILGERLGDLLVRSEGNVAQLLALKRAGFRLNNAETCEADRFGATKCFLNNMLGILDDGSLIRIWGTRRDITEEKRIGETVRSSEERLRRITEATKDALWEIDLAANQLWWSEGAKPLFGHSPGELQIRLEDWFHAIHPDDRDRVRRKFMEFMSNDDTDWSEQYRFLRADGVYADIEDKGRKFFAENGQPARIAGAMVDITERKAAEKALRESEERFEKAFRASPDALVISRIADGVILDINDNFVSLSGFQRKDLIGKSTLQLDIYVNRADRQRAVALLDKHHGVRDFEFLMRRRSGETRFVSFSAQPITVHGEQCWLTIGRDITERKLIEKARRTSEEEAKRQLAYIEAIYATAPVGLCYVDTDLRYRSINQYLAEIDGVAVEEHIGRTLAEIVPELAPTIEPIFRKVIETGEPVLNFDVSKVAKGKPAQHFIGSYYPIKDHDQRVIGVNVVVVEITHRKQVEQERERILLQEKRAREEAEEANRLKDEFLATISHELRTPLTAILGWAHLLTGGDLSESKARHALEVIEQSAKAQARLVDDILDTSRIITGRLQFDARPVDIERVFQAAIDVIRPSAEAKQIDLRVSIGGMDKIVFGDANRLQQVIWNLLSNAVKFTRQGGHIEARINRRAGQIEISVTDSGIGIEPQFLPFVFDRFRQADSASTRRYGGLGLGLAIVRHVVEMHGGSVSATSPGKGLGSTFTVRFPASSPMPEPPQTPPPKPPAAAAPPAGQPSASDSRRLDGVRALVVDDDPDTLEMLRFVLSESGAEVVAATSSHEALQAMDHFRPDVLISDVAMPDEDGYDLITRIRLRDPEHGGAIPAVALSAYARPEDRERATAAGFQLHLGKPIEPDALIEVIAGLTGRLQAN
ncbi:MAG TPA: PAS domain S-box protein [Terriglobia bacterium]|nr:PAS domain S-box protein [Terriglobia bacterium]